LCLQLAVLCFVLRVLAKHKTNVVVSLVGSRIGNWYGTTSLYYLGNQTTRVLRGRKTTTKAN